MAGKTSRSTSIPRIAARTDSVLSERDGRMWMRDPTRIGRFTAPADRDIVVFLLGARINTSTAVRSWVR